MPDLLDRLKTALAGRYAIERELGSGGMAIVYLARDLKHDRLVAIKVLRPEIAVALGSERFLQEIQIAAKLNHPHILALHDSGEADGFLFYVMPHVEGESLRERLNREKQLGVADALRFTEQVASALDYAHGQAVIHRDIKPENILLHEGVAIVADFGIALAVSAAGGERLTETGLSVGTPEYMSPEQGSGGGEIDSRSDLYSLGCVVYEMFAGHPPFTGTTAQEILARHSLDPVPSLRAARAAVSATVENALSKALGKVPADRFATSLQFFAALTGADVSGAPGRKTMRVVGVVSGLIAAGVAGGLLLNSPNSPDLNPDLLAIAPFDVLDPNPDLQLWSEGLIDLLSRSLDGAGTLRTVSPTLVIRHWEGRADLMSSAALGRATGARLALYGSLVRAGADSVRLAAALVDVNTTDVLAEFEYRGLAERVDLLADSLTLGTLRELGRSRPGGRARLSAMGTLSFPAVKAFLKGEQFYRRTNWDSAQFHYERAVATDSTFAIALVRLNRAITWQNWLRGDSPASSNALQAGRFNRGLAPRESLLVAADSLYASVLTTPWTESGRYDRARRLMTLLGDGTSRYPKDPELWELLGDARAHIGFEFGGFGGTDEEALAALERAVDLDPAFGPAYVNHVLQLALELRGPERALSLARQYLALDPTGPEVVVVRLLVALLDPMDRGHGAAQELLDGMSVNQLARALEITLSWPDTAETAVRIARSIQDLSNPVGFVAYWALAFRGHVREALGVYPMWSDAVSLGAIGPDSAAAAYRESLAGKRGMAFLGLSAWTATRDSLSIQQLIVSMKEIALTAYGDTGFAAYGAAVAQAHLALARDDSTEALRRFLGALRYPENGRVERRMVLPESVCPVYACFAERLQLARLLTTSGRDTDAAAVLDWSYQQSGVSLRPLFALEGGRVHDRLGNRDTAIASYSFVVDAWRNPDPELQALVDEARAALARLTGEPRR